MEAIYFILFYFLTPGRNFQNLQKSIFKIEALLGKIPPNWILIKPDLFNTNLEGDIFIALCNFA